MAPTTISSRWFDSRDVRPDSALRLVCFPHAGASAFVYRSWRDALPSSVDVVAMHLPGRGARIAEPPLRQLESIVDAVRPAIAPLLDRPLALFGHSVGAAIAFELARRLQAEGRPPDHLFVSGRMSPPRRPPRESYHLPAAEFIQVLRDFNGMPAEMLEDPEARDLLMPILRADFEASETYRYTPGPRLCCPITAFGGYGDPLVSTADVQAWREHTSASFSARMFRGDHFFVSTAQADILQVIAGALRGRPSTNTAIW